MNVCVTIDVPYYGLVATVEVCGTYTLDTFEPTSVHLDKLANRDDPLGYEDVNIFLPLVSDFYSDHAEQIDDAVTDALASLDDIN